MFAIIAKQKLKLCKTKIYIHPRLNEHIPVDYSLSFHPLPSQTWLAEVMTCVANTTGSETSINRGKTIKLRLFCPNQKLLCPKFLHMINKAINGQLEQNEHC